MSNFASLKKSSADIGRLTKEIEKINQPQSNERQEDNRFWKLERDKTGNGSAVIRFLPAPAVDGDDGLPWVRYFDHGFKGPTGKWYIENSLTSLNQKDPLGELNSQLWNASSDDNSWQRKQARDQKRRLHYVANIYIVSDPKHPENEGKVFLFKFGKKIFDMLTLAMNPQYEGDLPMNPFDLWKGANFKLRTRTVAGYPNYDQSSFDNTKPLSDDDGELERIWKSEHSVKEILSPSNFKTYEELKKRLDEVLGSSAGAVNDQITDSVTSRRSSSREDMVAQSKPTFDSTQTRKSMETASDTAPWSDDADEDLNYFKSLAED